MFERTFSFVFSSDRPALLLLWSNLEYRLTVLIKPLSLLAASCFSSSEIHNLFFYITCGRRADNKTMAAEHLTSDLGLLVVSGQLQLNRVKFFLSLVFNTRFPCLLWDGCISGKGLWPSQRRCPRIQPQAFWVEALDCARFMSLEANAFTLPAKNLK